MTDAQKNTIEGYKRQIESLKFQIKGLTERKKNISSDYSSRIKNARDSSAKADLNKSKKNQIDSITKDIQGRKFSIEQVKKQLTSYKESIRR